MLAMMKKKPVKRPTFSLAIIGSRGRIFDAHTVTQIDNLIRDLERFDYDVDLLTGCAAGADTCARMYAAMHDWDIEVHYAEWKQHGKKAGYLRNETMASICDGVLACPDSKSKISKGTGHMLDICKRLGKRAWICNPDSDIVRYF